MYSFGIFFYLLFLVYMHFKNAFYSLRKELLICSPNFNVEQGKWDTAKAIYLFV